jgi:hypothetical protein
MGGDRGGVKRGGKLGEKGVKNTPRPSLVSIIWGPGWGVSKKLPRGGEIPLLPCAWAASPLAAPPLDPVGPVFDCPLYEGSILLSSFGWAVAGGVLASRYTGGFLSP